MIATGHPRFNDPEIAAIQSRAGNLAAWQEAFKRHGVDAPTHASGDFAVAIRVDERRTFLAVDRFAIRTMCYALRGGTLLAAERANELAPADAALAPQSIYDYLYFHVIPAPKTIFRDVHRLPAGHYALFDNGKLTVVPWWEPVFEEGRKRPVAELKEEFLYLVRQGVERAIEQRKAGCFLSGGTDSSTVAGMLGQVTGSRPATFSIGFEADGYDEMEYARIAARHFNADHHEYYVTPNDLVRSIPTVAASYDQPFGNSSVLPTYYCAKLAKQSGVEIMLGGDGGDELFGGNTRYAKQRLFGLYDAMPHGLRSALLETALLRTGLGKLPLLRKGASYVEQARVPMPDRLQMYNLLIRLGLKEVLEPDFLRQIDSDEPFEQQRVQFRFGAARTLINRMLAYDWKYTLADNDLPKVVGATSIAQMPVGFPLLDDQLVDFSLRLHPEYKLKGLQLRWFFKEALRGFLPDEILTKKKHGFGLPFGVWVTTHAELRSLAEASLAGLRDKGIIRPEFLKRLSEELLPLHPGYYGEMVWILMMLAQWLRHRASLGTVSRILVGQAQ